MANTTRTNRKSWWQTIKRWFGMKAESANDAMDTMVDVETQLNRKIRELREQRQAIIGSDKLSRALGLATQLEDELVRENKSYAQANYDNTIRTLKANGDIENAKQVLMKKKSHEDKIARIKENYKNAQLSRDKIQSDLDLLDTNIAKANQDLEELKQRNRYAEQTEEIYDLMNEIGSIQVGYDTEGIQDAIAERERQVAGKRVLHDRSNTVANAQYQATMSALDDELANY